MYLDDALRNLLVFSDILYKFYVRKESENYIKLKGNKMAALQPQEVAKDRTMAVTQTLHIIHLVTKMAECLLT